MMNSKSVTFVLPCAFNYPAGGPKVVFEYANRLVTDGWCVNIAYLMPHSSFRRKNLLPPLRQEFNRWFGLKTNNFTARKWFPLDERISEFYPESLLPEKLPPSTIYVATGVNTAKPIADLPVPNNRKFYLIQGFENWGRISAKEVIDTYRYSMTRLVISRWLMGILNREKIDCIYLPNGFDFSYFSNYAPIGKRDKFRIALMGHTSENKGVDISLKALDIVKNKYPALSVQMFGAQPFSRDLPDWITFTQRPSKEEHNAIYNNASIYVSASRSEGWGLTIGEAMICGCAVACTDNDGFREMVTDGETGLLSPIDDSIALANNIIRLIEDNDFRIRIAQNGNRSIQKFTWDNSYHTLERLFSSSIED